MATSLSDVRRIRRALVAGQVFAGIGLGSAVSVGSLLAAHVAGGESAAGLAATMSTLGSAVAAIPLARVAMQRGRRRALTIGASVAVLGVSLVIVDSPQYNPLQPLHPVPCSQTVTGIRERPFPACFVVMSH